MSSSLRRALHREAARLARRRRTVRAVVDGVRALSPAGRRVRQLEARDLAASGVALRAAFHGVGPTCSAAPRTVLIPGLLTVRHILLQAVVVAGLIASGHRPVVLLFTRNRSIRRAYEAMGVRDFVGFERYDGRAPAGTAAALFAGVQTQEQLLAVEYDGIRVGRYAASSLLRAQRRGRVDLTGAGGDSARVLLAATVDHARAARRIIADLAPDAALFLDKGYTPHGPLFDACLDAGVDTLTWNMAHRDNALLLRRYSKGAPDEHPASLSPETWAALREAPWDDSRRHRVTDEIERGYTTGQWYSEVGTQFRTQSLAAEDVRHRLGLRPGRPVAAVFPHIFWDATFFWGEDVFSDYEEWFVETLRVAYEMPEVDWIVKVHPANLVKNARDGVVSAPSEVTAMERLGPAPDHVTVIPADSEISTLSLLEVIDHCVTVRGTVGIEAACLGKNVITAGTGRYDRRGFTIDASSSQEYRDLLRQLPKRPPPTDEAIDLARRYAYGLFLVRPLELHAFEAAFRHDAAASLDIRIRAGSWSELKQSADVRDLECWLRSGRTDLVSCDEWSQLTSPRAVGPEQGCGMVRP